MAQRGVLGPAVAAELAPPLGDLIEFPRTDLRCRSHHFGEVDEVPTPVAITDREEKILLRRKVLVDRAFRVTGGVGNIVERRRDETLFAENLLGGIDQE